MANLYQILGVSDTANADQIKKAYRKLAKIYHPDKNPNNLQAAEKFKEVNQAYQLLSDPIKKAQYDAVLFYRTYNIPTPSSSTNTRTYQTKSNPYQAEPQELTPEQKRRIAEKKRKRYIKAFNRAAVATVFLLLFLGSTAGVIEYKRYLHEQEVIAKEFRRSADIDLLYKEIPLAIAEKRFDDAYEGVNELNRLNTYSLTFLSKTNTAVFEEGIRSYNNTDFEVAIELFQNYLAHAGGSEVFVYIQLANSYLQLKDFENAEEAFLNLTAELKVEYRSIVGLNIYSIDPTKREDFHFDAFYGLGSVQRINGKSAEAIRSFEFARFLRPQRPETYNELRDLYREIGDESMAILYEEYIEDLSAK